MADISKIRVDGIDYNVKDVTARSLTPSDIGALPLDGGTLSGTFIGLNDGKSEVQSFNTSTCMAVRNINNSDNNIRKLAVYSYLGKPNIGESIQLFDVVDGISTSYKIYGEHNSAMLPKVTSEDNGKILKVVNGVWTAVAE